MPNMAVAKEFVPQALRNPIATALEALYHDRFGGLRFPPELEQRFEKETRKDRSHRMWFEGLTAILVFNACLFLDSFVIHDPLWLVMVKRTATATPVALVVNLLMRTNPVRWLREGSVAVAMIAICFINLGVQGNTTPTTTLFGLICLLIAALFAGVVMRLRIAYTVASILIMLPAGVWSVVQAECLSRPEAVVAISLMVVGLGIILVASYSLERAERTGYLLGLTRDMQAEELEETNAKLQTISCIDKLTGLPNRRLLEERFAQLWDEGIAAQSSLAIVVVDIDHFKFVNDVYGHLRGDDVLRRIGWLLPQALRGPGDMAARFGGEEFVLLLPNAELGLGMTIGERTRQIVEAANVSQIDGAPTEEALQDGSLFLTISCGVSACIPTEALQWTDLLAAADDALYAAKRAGRNRVEFQPCDHAHPVTKKVITPAQRRELGRRFGPRRAANATSMENPGVA